MHMDSVIEVINERISCADSILSKLSALISIPRRSNYSGVISIDYTVRYDNEKVNQIIDELSKWQFVTKELLINLFGEENRFVKRFDNTIIEHKKGWDHKAELTRETEDGVNALNTIIESIQLSGGPSENGLKENGLKAPLVFISHSSKDRLFVEALVELLEGIGLDEKTLFCSSIPGYWIGLSKDIYEALLSLFTNHSLYVVFVQSPNFYSSPVSLNEMGAAWALKANYCSILTPEMEFSAMTAVVNSHEVAIKVNNKDAKPRLTELKNSLLDFLGKPAVSDVVWERRLDKFLQVVSPSYVSDSSSTLSIKNNI